MGSFEINSAELSAIISQYQRIGGELSNYSGQVRREIQRLNSQRGFGIETVRKNLNHLSKNSNSHSRDAYIFGAFLKDLETESNNAENQVNQGMYNATPTKKSLPQLIATALGILTGFVFSTPLIAPIVTWLEKIKKITGDSYNPGKLPTPIQPPKPSFPPIGGVIVGGIVGGIAGGTKVPVTPETPIKPVTPETPIKPVTPETPKEPVTPETPKEPVTPETPKEPTPTTDGPDVKVGDQIDRNGSTYTNRFARGQCTWFAHGRVEEITGKTPEMLREYSKHPQGWLNGNTFHTDTANGGCIANGKSVDFQNGEIPQRGAFMSWSHPSPFGHVAVVEKVVSLGNGDYEVIFSDANWDSQIYEENPASDGTVRSVKMSALKNDGTFTDFTELI